ncbi:putative PEP-binding protein [Shigella flexneri]
MRRRWRINAKQQAQAAAQLAYSRDNTRIDIAANIGTLWKHQAHVANGAEGVGAVPYPKCCIGLRQRAGRAGAF